jgi:LPS-assembly lipoprotein
MSWFKKSTRSLILTGLLAISSLGLASCTVQPLNSVNSPGSVSPSELAGVEIPEVTTRVAQQVRNHLIFGLNGGGQPSGATHVLKLNVSASKIDISVETSTQSPAASQVTVTAQYTLSENSNKQTIATGIRQAIASFDRTNQSFANQRAERDAENRAAKEVAEQLRLIIAATLAGK